MLEPGPTSNLAPSLVDLVVFPTPLLDNVWKQTPNLTAILWEEVSIQTKLVVQLVELVVNREPALMVSLLLLAVVQTLGL